MPIPPKLSASPWRSSSVSTVDCHTRISASDRRHSPRPLRISLCWPSGDSGGRFRCCNRAREISRHRLRRRLVDAGGHSGREAHAHQLRLRAHRRRRARRVPGPAIRRRRSSRWSRSSSGIPRCRVLISVGGWEADGFSDAALTEASRDGVCAKRDGADARATARTDSTSTGSTRARASPASSTAPRTSRTSRCCSRKLREQLDAASEADGRKGATATCSRSLRPTASISITRRWTGCTSISTGSTSWATTSSTA